MKQRFIDTFTALVNSPKRLALTVLAVWAGCSWTYSLLEGKGPIEGLWWGIVTGSTVGYGDFYPETTAGRFVGAVLIVSMLILTACAVTQLVGLADRNAWTHEEQEELLRLTRENNEMLRQQHSENEWEQLMFGRGFGKKKKNKATIHDIIRQQDERHAREVAAWRRAHEERRLRDDEVSTVNPPYYAYDYDNDKHGGMSGSDHTSHDSGSSDSGYSGGSDASGSDAGSSF